MIEINNCPYCAAKGVYTPLAISKHGFEIQRCSKCDFQNGAADMSKYGRYRIIDPDNPSFKGFDKMNGKAGVTVDELEKMGFRFLSVPEPYSLEVTESENNNDRPTDEERA